MDLNKQEPKTTPLFPSAAVARDNVVLPEVQAENFVRVKMPAAHMAAVAAASPKAKAETNFSGDLLINSENDVFIALTEVDRLSARWNLFTKKVFYFAAAEFVNAGCGENCTVAFSVEDFLRTIGAENISREGKKKRTKEINEALDILYKAEIVTRGGARDRLIAGRTPVKKGFARVTFHPGYADIMRQSPMTLLHKSLFLIDGKCPNAFAMGVNMARHYFMDANIVNQREQRLCVATLLKCCSLPQIDEVRKNEKSWRERIKEPFEIALGELVKAKFLRTWHYCLKGKKDTGRDCDPMPDTFEEWAKLYVYFEICDSGNNAERMEDVRTRRSKKALKAAQTRNTKSSKPKQPES